jgi:hypothetical protein
MDSLAAAEPERIVFSLTTFSGDSLEFRHISARAFTKAVDKTAWWLHSQVGKSDSIRPVGYIGPRTLAKSTWRVEPCLRQSTDFTIEKMICDTSC